MLLQCHTLQVCYDTKKEWFMQKTSCSLTTVFALLFFVVGVGASFAAWDGTAKTKPSTEKIDGKDFFLIENEANLAWFRDSVNSVSGTIKINAKLMASLDMGHKLFMPIASGSGAIKFGGIFDGNNQTISNLYLNSDELGEIPNEFCPKQYPKCNAQNVGFIGVLEGGTVKNLNLENVDILASTNKGVSGGKDNPISVGPVVGYQRTGFVENCFASGDILTSGKGNSIGGLVGNSWKESIKNSLSTVNVWVSGDDSYVGGVVGSIREGDGVAGNVTIEACVYDGSIIINSGNGTAGGVVGFYEKGALSVSRSYYDTDIIDVGLGKKTDSLEMVGSISSAKNLNMGKVVCDLNGGTWDSNAGTCSAQGIWSVGASHIALRGVSQDADGNIVYAITFDANGGEFQSGAKSTKFLKAGDLITADEISTPVRGDTVFGGWALSSDATGPAENFGTVSGPDTIFAYWKTMYEVTFDATTRGVFDADGDAPSNIRKKLVAEGEAIDVDGIGVPQYANDGTTYFFAGWRASEDDEQALDNLGTASGPTTFYALWVLAPTYTVTFNTHGFGTTVVYVQETAEKDQKVARPDDPVADGREFAGWFESENATEPFSFDSTVIEDNLELHAKWKLVNYTITYKVGSGKNNSGNPSSYNIESDDIKLKIPTQTGFSFDGWYYDSDLTNVATQISKGTTGDKTFYAKWKKKTYTITYMAGSYGAEVIPAETKAYGESIKLKGAVYTRANYIQKGWATENGGKKVYDLGATYTTDKSLMLYPYWEADPASIRYGATSRLGSFSVAVQGRTLDIFGAKSGASWAVYDMQGSLVARGIVGSGSSRVEIQKAGSYIVRMDGQFRTVRIR